MTQLSNKPSSPTISSCSSSSDLVKNGSSVVVVTGGAGFIGFHTSKALLARGDEVVIIDEMNDYYDPQLKQSNLDYLTKHYGKSVHIYIGDLCDQAFVANVFKENTPDSIIHLAARAGVRPSINDPLLYVQSNIFATTVLLELSRKYKLNKFVYASSSSVYGGSDKELFKETDIVDFPVSPYAASKKSCELLAHTYHHLYKLNCIGLRFFTVYGPRGRPDMAPFKFMDRIARGIEIQQYGDGSSSRDYTYIDDIVNGVLLSLDYGTGCEIYNLGNGNPVYLSEFIGMIEKLLNKKAIIRILPDQPGDVPRTCADVSKAKNDLGYSPTVSFYEGLKRTLEWYNDYC